MQHVVCFFFPGRNVGGVVGLEFHKRKHDLPYSGRWISEKLFFGSSGQGGATEQLRFRQTDMVAIMASETWTSAWTNHDVTCLSQADPSQSKRPTTKLSAAWTKQTTWDASWNSENTRKLQPYPPNIKHRIQRRPPPKTHKLHTWNMHRNWYLSIFLVRYCCRISSTNRTLPFCNKDMKQRFQLTLATGGVVVFQSILLCVQLVVVFFGFDFHRYYKPNALEIVFCIQETVLRLKFR